MTRKMTPKIFRQGAKRRWQALIDASLFVALGLVGFSSAASGEATAKTVSTIVPFGNPEAPVGGTLQVVVDSEPTTLNPYSSSDLYARIIQQRVLDSLISRNPETYEFEPWLAEKFTVSPDGLTFTFVLRSGVKWHDGRPLTVKDVVFSFNAMKDPAYGAAHLMPYFENIEKAEALNEREVRFTAKQKYFGNLSAVGGLQIVPEHVYRDPKKKNSKILVGSGPYALRSGDYQRGKAIILKRNPDWWGWKVPELKGLFNFAKLHYRFVKETNAQLELVKKKQLDFLSLRPEDYMLKTSSEPWGTNIKKMKVQNDAPKSYGFVAWNLRHPFFGDKKVRKALSHLMNREQMNEKFRFNMSEPTPGPWYQASPYADKNVKPLLFDLARVKKLLAEAGWKDSDKDGILDREIDGARRPFRFELMFSNPDIEKYFTLYKEDLRKAGIDMILKRIEWNTFVDALDQRKFDAVTLAWGGGSVDNDPKQIWHSASAKGTGSNFIGYSNPKVDALIDRGREELDDKKRIPIFQEVYRLIAEDAPYSFFFNERYALYGVWDHIGMVKPIFRYEFGYDSLGYSSWWLKP